LMGDGRGLNRSTVTSVGFSVLLACIESAMGQSESRLAIDDFATAYSGAFEAGDVDAIMELVTDECVALTPDKPPLVGRDRVRKEFESDFKTMRVKRLRFEHEGDVLTGEWAYAWGRSSAEVILGSESMRICGKYLWILRRMSDGSWKLSRDSTSGDRPPDRLTP